MSAFAITPYKSHGVYMPQAQNHDLTEFGGPVCRCVLLLPWAVAPGPSQDQNALE